MMDMQLTGTNKKKVLMLAIGGGILVGASTMFIPVGILEKFTGNSGLTEIFPSTKAPLGDTARALIAFAAGVISMPILASLFWGDRDSESDGKLPGQKIQRESEQASMMVNERLASLKSRMPKISLPKMPWANDDDAILDLSDLPKLRGQDSHPDAPPRAPLSASADLITPDITKLEPFPVAYAPPSNPQPDQEPHSRPIAETPGNAPFSAHANPQMPYSVEENSKPAEPAPKPATEFNYDAARLVQSMLDKQAAEAAVQEKLLRQVAAAARLPADIDAMIDHLEQGLVRRSAQLEMLEELAAKLHSKKSDMAEVSQMNVVPAMPNPSHATADESPLPYAPLSRPPLEEVKTERAEPAAMDTALNAALETLQRMNAQSR